MQCGNDILVSLLWTMPNDTKSEQVPKMYISVNQECLIAIQTAINNPAPLAIFKVKL